MGVFDFLKPKPKPPPELVGMAQQVTFLSFPGGEKQIKEETGQLHALLRGKLSKSESRTLLRRTKIMLIVANDKSEDRITASILRNTGGKLTQHEAHLVYVFLTGMAGPTTAGGDGSSAEQAVIINATSSIVGVSEEYDYIERICGKRDVDYRIELQMQTEQNGRKYDVLSLTMKDGSERTLWFDITAFFGKF